MANRDNIYTSWDDVPLSKKGIEQVKDAGLRVAKIPDFVPTHIHTFILSHAVMTASIIVDVCSFLYLPITKTWRLSERHYGTLRDTNKDVSEKIFGKEQVLRWGHGFGSVPLLLTQSIQDRGYQKYDMRLVPQRESLHQTQDQLMPYFWGHITPELVSGHGQLIVAHGSGLRAPIKRIGGIGNRDIVRVEVPNAEPIVYTFDSNSYVIKKEILH